jgi:hypothetical protein
MRISTACGGICCSADVQLGPGQPASVEVVLKRRSGAAVRQVGAGRPAIVFGPPGLRVQHDARSRVRRVDFGQHLGRAGERTLACQLFQARAELDKLFETEMAGGECRSRLAWRLFSPASWPRCGARSRPGALGATWRPALAL